MVGIHRLWPPQPTCLVHVDFGGHLRLDVTVDADVFWHLCCAKTIDVSALLLVLLLKL